MQTYRFKFIFRVTRSFELPHFQGPAIRNLLSCFKETQPELNSFFFEQKAVFDKVEYNGYAIMPCDTGNYTNFKDSEFAFEIIVFGKALQQFGNILQFMCLTGFTDLGKRLELQRIENRLSDTESKTIVSFAEAQAYQNKIPTVSAEVGKFELKFDTPVCIKNNNHANDFTFNRIINVAAHRANAIKLLFGNETDLFDTAQLSELANAVQVTENKLKPYFVQHYSKPIKYRAFVGSLVFEGNVQAFLPLLQFAEQIQIGKETASGLGKISLVL